MSLEWWGLFGGRRFVSSDAALTGWSVSVPMAAFACNCIGGPNCCIRSGGWLPRARADELAKVLAEVAADPHTTTDENDPPEDAEEYRDTEPVEEDDADGE